MGRFFSKKGKKEKNIEQNAKVFTNHLEKRVKNIEKNVKGFEKVMSLSDVLYFSHVTLAALASRARV